MHTQGYSECVKGSSKGGSPKQLHLGVVLTPLGSACSSHCQCVDSYAQTGWVCPQGLGASLGPRTPLEAAPVPLPDSAPVFLG